LHLRPAKKKKGGATPKWGGRKKERDITESKNVPDGIGKGKKTFSERGVHTAGGIKTKKKPTTSWKGDKWGVVPSLTTYPPGGNPKDFL